MARDYRDCPPCASCGEKIGTPIRDSRGGMNADRWDGPPDATLFCPSCGAGWIGTPEHVAWASESWEAYEAECER